MKLQQIIKKQINLEEITNVRCWTGKEREEFENLYIQQIKAERKIMGLNGQHREEVNNIDQFGEKFISAYNEKSKFFNNRGLECSVYIEKIIENVYSFTCETWGRSFKINWDFKKDCKADFRKKYYRELLV